jgi:hypothetical protein
MEYYVEIYVKGHNVEREDDIVEAVYYNFDWPDEGRNVYLCGDDSLGMSDRMYFRPGMTEAGFIDTVSKLVWEMNGGYCDVRIVMHNYSLAPKTEYQFTELDYKQVSA